MSSPRPESSGSGATIIVLSRDQWEQVRRYLGLARRAGQLLIGLEQVRKARQPLLVVASDARPVPATGVYLQLVIEDPAEPGRTLGKEQIRVVGLPAGELARHIEKLLTTRKD